MFWLDENGDWRIDTPPVPVIVISRVAPVADDELIGYAGMPMYIDNPIRPGTLKRLNVNNTIQSLSVWKKKTYLEKVQELAGTGAEDKNKEGETVICFKRTKMLQVPTMMVLWQKPEMHVLALAISRNAILVAHAVNPHNTSQNEVIENKTGPMKYDGWKLSAFQRETGEEIWGVRLPEEPLINGLVVSAGGAILVAMRDGAVACVTTR